METILHLTDIHFGWEGTEESGLAYRKVCLDGLLNELRELPSQWKPTIICLTGDIAWRGTASDYSSAKTWLDQLLEVCELTYTSMVVCPGNHDVIRASAKKIPRPDSATDSDDVLDPPIAPHFESPFSGFIRFCADAGIPCMKFGDYDSHLVGVRELNGIHFITLNSAWFSKDNNDKNKLWIGLPQIRFMESHKQIIEHPNQSDRTTIALLHHPQDWLHSDEIHANAPRPNTVDYLAHRCHMLLTGHTHGEVRGADRIADQALHFTGGSAYAGASHFNSFRLIQISNNLVDDRTFDFNPVATEKAWRSRPANRRPLSHACDIQFHGEPHVETMNTAELRAFCRNSAIKHIENRSRLLRRFGTLPTYIELPVLLRVSLQQEVFDPEGRFVRASSAEQQRSLYDAVRESRRTMLLGDLGMGKSTLAAQLVVETIDRSASGVGFFIPVKALKIAGQFTQRDLITSINKYVRDEIWVASLDFSLESVLNQRIEVLLVFDGLDELSRDLAARMLKQAGAMVENWPTIQIVSTARPVELVGASYSGWQIAHTVALNHSAKREFLRRELIADGVPDDQIEEDVGVLFLSLKEATSLDAIATTPLAIRLIYPRLKSFSLNSDLTLGDLLYEMLVERLEGWQKRDDKPSAYLHLEEILPTADAKAEYLAVLAEKATAGKRLSRDEARALLHESAANFVGSNTYKLADEALSFYEWLGLISVSDMVEFPLQPLAEVCAAVGLVGVLHANAAAVSAPDRAAWRAVSFSAAIARRRGWMNDLREAFSAIVASLLTEKGYVPVVCYIVVEANDTTLAETAVRLIDNFAYRPLRYFHDEQKASSRNIARTLVLAGHMGFEWFYNDYLNPRIPFSYTGSSVVTEVFSNWITINNVELSDAQKELLSGLVRPYQATGENHLYGLLPLLSLLVPEAFSPGDKFRAQALLLDGPHSPRAERTFREARADLKLEHYVSETIYQHCGASIIAGLLWLEFNPEKEPPYELICQSLRLTTKATLGAKAIEIINQSRARIGEDRWARFARWAVATEERSTGVGAAKVLYGNGERRLSILGRVLLEAMHDGGYVAEAERILGELVSDHGEDGVRWLARRTAEASEWHGSHSGWWRILLRGIGTIDNGPDILASCVRSLGPYILPRYPEVREAFSRVLNGANGQLFRNALRVTLKSLDPNSRRGAALVLVSTDPQGEAEALFVAVRSRAQDRHFEWQEWESFCLTLRFEYNVLAFLKSKLELLDPKSRILALALLKKGGIDIGPDYCEELVRVLATHGNWHIAKEPMIEETLVAKRSFEELIGELDNTSSDISRFAAERLIALHLGRLTKVEEARCWTLRYGSSLSSWVLEENLERISRDPDFAQALVVVGKESLDSGSRLPLLCAVANAVVNITGWKDVVWAVLCDDIRFGGSSDGEEGGMALLEFGLVWIDHKEAIGQAAKEFLADPRIWQNPWAEASHWLAVIADEFVGLDLDTIRRVIVHGEPIHYSATTALIARLGEVPAGFKSRRNHTNPPAHSALSAPAECDAFAIITRLREYCRDSKELHPRLIETIQCCLLLPPLDEATLCSIRDAGQPGILVSTLLRYIYGFSPRMEDTIPCLDVASNIWWNEQQNSASGKFARIWRMLREATVFEDRVAANSYVAALDQALLEGCVWKLAIAWEIFNIRGALSNSQIPIVFAAFAEHLSFLHEILFSQISTQMAADISEDVRRSAISAAETAIVKLNEAPWHIDSAVVLNPWANLLFPAILWAEGCGNTIETEVVFLRGLRDVFEKIPSSQQDQRSDLTRLLAKLDPLLAKAASKQLESVILRGIESQEPSVSVFCRLIGALGHRD